MGSFESDVGEFPGAGLGIEYEFKDMGVMGFDWEMDGFDGCLLALCWDKKGKARTPIQNHP